MAKKKSSPKRTKAKQSAANQSPLQVAHAASEAANRAFDTLLHLAGGEHPENHYAASCLVHLLSRTVGNFQWFVEDVQRRPKQARLTNHEIEKIVAGSLAPQTPQLDFAPFAREKDSWPMLYHAHRERRKRGEELIGKLELGKGTGLQFDGDGKPWSYFTRANQIVLDLRGYIQRCSGYPPCGMIVLSFDGERKLTAEDQKQFAAWIREHASGIPQLSLESVALKRWIKAGKALLPIMFGSEFWNHRRLAPLAAKAEQTREGHPANWSQRKCIWSALAKAWKSVAADAVGDK